MGDQTIYAPASGQAKAGIAVLRISGPAAGVAARAITARPLPQARMAARRRFIDPSDESVIDEGLLLWFPAPASYTGEDVAELQVHGGMAVRAALMRVLGALPDCRLAEPGEFTRRAFLNGRMDLSQAEGVVDLIEAETEAQRAQALRQAEGGLAQRCQDWAGRLLTLAAHAEALIDFPDEELPPEVRSRNEIEMQRLRDGLTQALGSSARGERVRDGVRVAIVGPPNAGKSSLLNRLAGRDAAIVNARAGTTRDVIEVAMDLDGYAVTLSDTAGLRAASDEIEGEGVRRAQAIARGADIILAVRAVDEPTPIDAWLDGAQAERIVQIVNKIDLGHGVGLDEAAIALSVESGAGWDGFVERLSGLVRDVAGLSETAGLTRARHREAVSECVAALTRAQAIDQPDLQAEDLRMAVRALGRITGAVDVEDILDVVFRDFCIGK
jgi:tRNA modification GTPase